jgi:hypothetical protein
MSILLLPDLPPSLDGLIRDLYSDPVLARRALLAPWPGEFRSAYDERALWRSDEDPQRSAHRRSRSVAAIVPIAPDPFFHNRPETQTEQATASDKAPKTVAEAEHFRRKSFERVLRQERELFQSVEQPYFVSDGTQGTLRSPYAEMSDGEYWMYVTLYGSEQAARQSLEERIVPGLSHQTTIQFLRRAQNPGLWNRLRRFLRSASDQNPHASAWYAQTEIIFPVYL